MLAQMNTKLSRWALAGISLVEVMVALAVLGILLAAAAPSLGDLMTKQRMRAVAAEISTDLAWARAESGLRPQNVFVGFRHGNGVSCYTIHLFASVGQCNCTLAEGASCSNSNARELKTMRLPLSSGVKFEASGTFANNMNLQSFDTPHMIASVPDFEVILTNSKGTNKLRLYLNGMGRVVTCTPNDSFSGVPAC
jgi:prepilin-type N-terminal cleavage/methylation domain-containing protein